MRIRRLGVSDRTDLKHAHQSFALPYQVMRSFRIETQDGYSLAAVAYDPPSTSPHAAWIVVAAATGVPQGFYRRFAVYMQSAGYGVLTFDYRGIAASAPRSMRGFNASFLDWAQLDLAAVVAWAGARGDVLVVGHSFGGQAYGLLSPEPWLRGLVAFGTGNGWHGHMSRTEGMKARLMWHVLGPPLTLACGYLPSKQLGLGEPLPVGVYKQWKRWCAREQHWFADASVGAQSHFDRIKAPVVSYNVSDDAWAGPKSGRSFFSHYRRAPVEMRTPSPADLGLSAMGHMGYFRASAEAKLWPEVLVVLQSMGRP